MHDFFKTKKNLDGVRTWKCFIKNWRVLVHIHIWTNPACLLISEVEQARNVQLAGKKHIQSAGGVGKEIEINCPTSLFTSFMDEGRD